MTDRELLEQAAKAAGLAHYWDYVDGLGMREQAVHDVPHCGHTGPIWNPLNDDGDALRLAVRLWIDISVTDDEAMAEVEGHPISIIENANSKIYAATRRAIVRAAAAIGQAMP